MNIVIPENTDLNFIDINEKTEVSSFKSLNQEKNNFEFETLLQKSTGDQPLFQKILNALEPIDFSLEYKGKDILKLREMAENANDLRNKEQLDRKLEKLEPKPLQKYVIIIRKLLEIAEREKLGIGFYNLRIYFFNEKFWNVLYKEELEGFISKFAEKAGLDALDAQQYKVVEMLLKQFESTAYLPGFKSAKKTTRIPFKNGTLVFENGNIEFVDFNKEHYLTYNLQFEYDSSAAAPLFQKYLDRVLPDIELQEIIFEFFGTMFLKDVKHEKILLLLGKGQNGKSVLTDILQAMLGPNMTSLSLLSLSEHKSQSRALIENKLLNYSSEIGSTKNLDFDMVKKLASGEPVEIKEVFSKVFTMDNYARLAFNCNTLPRVAESSHGFHRRFLIVPFEQKISEEEKDINLAQKIIENELPGIFNLIIEGMRRFLLQGKFTYSEKTHQQSEKFKHDTNSVVAFLEEEQYVPSGKQHMRAQDFYRMYDNFCKENGFTSMNSTNLNNQLRDLGYEVRKSTNSYTHVYYDKLIRGIQDSAIIININKQRNNQSIN